MQKPLISFDYAIKYLLKDKKEYDIIEGFISALLGCEGYGPVKIKALLESESNKEYDYLKTSVADVIVADEQGNNYIVEIDRNYRENFLHKACFNSCRLIVDSIGTDQDYSEIKKIFHINILFFPVKGIDSALNHGKTIFHTIDQNHSVRLHLANDRMQFFDINSIFPEYFVISVPLFNDIVKQEIDEWLYFMKHSTIKENSKSPYMKKIAKRLSILTMTPRERAEYNEYKSESLKHRDCYVAAVEQGIAKGIAKGKIEGEHMKALEIAKKMLRNKMNLEQIEKNTNLSIEEIKNLEK